MLAARASTARNVQRITRSFATVVDTSGVKVAAVDHNQPTASVTVLVKAGSRFEPKEGVANALKNFAFKSTKARSAIGTVRESELYGGVLYSTLGREHLALTAEFLKADAPYFVDVLTSFVTSAKFARHEFEEYVAPLVAAEAESATHDPATRAIEAAHQLAFRSGLGSSLFAPAHNHITVEDIKSYASAAFTKGNIAVIGTGIDQATLSNLVEKSLAKAAAGTSASSPATKYFGGETRLDGHGGPQTVFVGFGTTGAPSAELATLAAHLSTTPSVKWSQGISPISSLPKGTSVQPVYLPYSDASLFGLLVQGTTIEGVKEAGKAAVAALKAAAKGISADELKSAVSKAKFAAASAVDTREGLVTALGSKAFSGSEVSLESTLSSLDNVNVDAFSKATASLLSAKPTFVAIGDSHALPYADELGL
ncbi:Cytochrome b-c1 complex subunit 2, mitochondrial [Psilocybe cubensis]|uniref:Cytochrome b-c1 complex subunit 2, mitochondrial n=1 Tax=Psilocybe cubensis TaxID=181762 RepID=A0ACB8GNP4_PSICU|nr:Cytochrome b-c1 complex subunit 2, mitochondrial [Psilocybe cubensis]KAH9476831.1 Cytochrome b-c1 complex subunit 2, mitochondrial [Psilocybe cubensis]